MKKNTFGRQFKRDANERKALFKGLMTQLVIHERIETTEEKAKAIKASIEKLVTKAKIQGMAAERLLLPYLHADAVKKMIDVIGPRFVQRPGGYTRIIRIGRRFNDDASLVLIEWVEKTEKVQTKSTKSGKGNDAKSTEKVESSAEVKTEDSKKNPSTGSGQIAAKPVRNETKPTKAVKTVKKTQAKQKEGSR